MNNSRLSEYSAKAMIVSNIRKPVLSGRVSLFLISAFCFSFVIVFSYLPLAGWIIAFFDYKPGLSLFQCRFVGLQFFKYAFTEPELATVLRNTLVMSFLGILSTPLPVVFAILLYEIRNRVFKKIVQTTTTLPHFISWILVYSVFFAMLSPGDGIVNKVLMNMKLIGQPLNPLGNSDIVWLLQAGIYVWKSLGFSAIIYLAAITSIDSELYDAVKIDGAGRFRKILHITVPGLAPIYITLLLLGIGNILSNGFEQYYLFYNPVVHERIQVLDFYLYRIGIMLQNYSLSTALGITKTAVSIVLLITANMIAKKVRGSSII